MAMAMIMDDPKAAPHHPAAARSLSGLLQELHKGGGGSGKLATMRAVRRTE
jgi:hypothetical protein